VSVLSPSQIAACLSAAGFPASEIPTGVAVALAESGGRTDETHVNSDGTTDYGLMQINSIHGSLLSSGDWRDPNANARMAYALWKDNGGSWRPWSSYNNGRYRLFTGRAVSAATVSAQPVVFGVPSLGLPSVFDVFSPHFWLRVGMFLLGGMLLLLALWRFLPPSTRSTVRSVAEMAAVA